MCTRNLVAKAFCYRRQLLWDLQDGRTPIINPATIETLQIAVRNRPPLELQRAAHDLGINLAEVGLHEC